MSQPFMIHLTMEAVPLTITLMKNYNYLVLAFMFQSQLSRIVLTLLRMPIEFDLFCKNPKDPPCLVVNALFDTGANCNIPIINKTFEN